MTVSRCGSAPRCRTRIGCFCQYVSDRQHHSSGPNRKCRSQIGLTINWNVQISGTI